MSELKPGFNVCKASVLPTVIPLWPHIHSHYSKGIKAEDYEKFIRTLLINGKFRATTQYPHQPTTIIITKHCMKLPWFKKNYKKELRDFGTMDRKEHQDTPPSLSHSLLRPAYIDFASNIFFIIY